MKAGEVCTECGGAIDESFKTPVPGPSGEPIGAHPCSKCGLLHFVSHNNARMKKTFVATGHVYDRDQNMVKPKGW